MKKRKLKNVGGTVLLGLLSLGSVSLQAAGDERLSVLMLGEPVDTWPTGGGGDLPGLGLAERTLLEALTNIRFTHAPLPHNGDTGALDLSALHGESEPMVAIRKQEVLGRLEGSFDAVIVAPGRSRNKLDGDIQQALVQVVRRGGTLIWLGGTLMVSEKGNTYPVANPELQALLPYQEGAPLQEFRGSSPLIGFPLGIGGLEIQPGRPAKNDRPAGNGFSALYSLSYLKGERVEGRWQQVEKEFPLVVFRSFGKGMVIGMQTDGNLFPRYLQSDLDGEAVWAECVERIVRFGKGEAQTPIVLTGEGGLAEDGSPSITLTLKHPEKATLALIQSDMHGRDTTLEESIELTAGNPRTVKAAASLHSRQQIRAVPADPAFTSGISFLQLELPVNLSLETLQQGNPPAYETRSRLTLQAKQPHKNLKLCWTVRDWSGHPVAYREDPLNIRAGEMQTVPFDYTLSDPDPRAWSYRLQAVVAQADGTPLARAETVLYRYRPYDMTEQILLATWHTEAIARLAPMRNPFFRYLRGMGFNAVKGAKNLDALEENNFRVYEEFGGSTTYGIRTAPFKEAIEDYPRRYQAQGVERAKNQYVRKTAGSTSWPSPALNIFSMGEETGFGRWSEAYPWRNEEAAPEECNKWFRFYLQQEYKELSKLNEQWGSDFKDWQEIKVWRKYAEPFGWLYRAPPLNLDENLSPYIDTHAFHEWYVSEFIHNFWEGYSSVNPIPTWTMSFDFTFLQRSPAPLTMISYAQPPENSALWHAYIRARTPGNNNPFSMNWAFFTHEGFNNQFLKLSYALGSTYLSTWGKVFSGDFTPTIPGITAARVRKEMEPAEAVFRHMKPLYDKRVGIYTFDSPWALARGRYGFIMKRGGPNDLGMGIGPQTFAGASYLTPPELPLYSALSASGYSPLYVTPEQFSDCKVLFLPYVEALPRAIADKLKEYVENGGTLIAFPVIAEFDAKGKPYGTHPGAGLDELFGFTAAPDWQLGRSPVTFPGRNAALEAFQQSFELTSGVDTSNDEKQRLEEAPLYFNFTPRIGGHPNYYLPEGHLNFSSLKEDTVVIARHENDQPLLTYRRIGKGRALCFNTLICNDTGLDNSMTAGQRETFRQIIAQITGHFAGEADFQFQSMAGYGEGSNEFATIQYTLPGSPVRILALYQDWRHPQEDTRLILRKNYRQVYDVLKGAPLTMMPGLEAGLPQTPVAVQPGDWRLLAFSEDPVTTPELKAPPSLVLGQTLSLTAQGSEGESAYGRLKILLNGVPSDSLSHYDQSVVLRHGHPLSLPTRLNDPAGVWTVQFTNAITGETRSCTVRVNSGEAAALWARGVTHLPARRASEQRVLQGPKISEDEFLSLLSRLRTLHLSPGAVDKRRYSYYHNEIEDSRQRVNQLLSCVDWVDRLPWLKRALEDQSILYLLGEELGVESRFGLSTTPVRNPGILDAVQQLVDEEDGTLYRLSGRPYLRVLRWKDSFLVLDRRSPDEAGHTNLHLASYHHQWLREMTELGLVPEGNPSNASLLPAGEETLAQWLRGPNANLH